MSYGNEFENNSSSLKQGEGEQMADGLGDNPSRFSKDGSPHYVNKEITFVKSK